jgi:predicted Zn-dependent peptidase
MLRALLLSCCTVSTLAVAQVKGAPLVPPQAAWAPPAPQVLALASGAKLWVVERPGLPLATVTLTLPAGSQFDPPELPGLANLTAEALQECGAGDRSAAELDALFDELGGEVSVSAGPSGTRLTLTTLSARLDVALGALVDLVQRPRFEPAAFASLQQREVASLRQLLERPTVLASAVEAQMLFGASPWGHLGPGLPAALARVTLDDVKQFHQAHLGSQGLVISVAGDVSAAQLKARLDQLAPRAFGAPAVALPALPTPGPAKWVAVDRPGAPQTAIIVARVALSAADPQRFAAELASIVLGGSFTSRLNQNLREKNGYTYGASAHFLPGRLGLLQASTSVRTDVTAPALEQLLLELKGLTSLSAEELAKSRALAQADLVDAFATGASVDGALAEAAAQGLPSDAARASARGFEGVTLEQAQAATKLFDPEAFTVVLVGDRAKIEKPLAKLFPQKSLTWVPAPGAP